MASLNKVFLLGRTTREIELKYTPSSAAVAEFGIAINEKYKEKESVVYVDVTAWNKTAENCQKYLSKGSAVMIEGRLQFDQWDDRETGKKRTKLTVTAINVQFIGSHSDSQRNEQGGQQAPQDSYNQDKQYQGEHNQSQPGGNFPAMPNDTIDNDPNQGTIPF